MVDLFGEPTPPPSSQMDNLTADEDISSDDQALEELQELTPRTNADLIGHTNVEQELLERIDTNKMPHALILHGPKGIGKATLAYRLARYLFKQSEDQGGLFAVSSDDTSKSENLFIAPEEVTYKQVASGGHPDLFTIECAIDEKKGTKKSSLDVDQIRKIAPFMRMTSNTLDGWRIVIVDDADTMTINAQNSLLKILEEPPKKALLILVTHRIGAMLPTIRSRCQSIAMTPLKSPECKEVIKKLNLDQSLQDEELLLDYAEGSPGVFANIMEEGGSECIESFLEILKSAPNFDPKMTHRFAENYGGYGKDKFFDLLHGYTKWVFRVLIKSKITGNKLPFFIADHNGLNQIHTKKSYTELLKTHDELDALMGKSKAKMLDK
ncbi:MAG: DNA polymerase III subunit delta', partial [Bdellovibrionales bacterium]